MFKFSLETVLTHRKHLETIAQKEFIELKQLLNNEMSKYDKIMAYLSRTHEELQKKQKIKTTASEVILHLDYVDRLNKQLHEQGKIVNEVKDKVEIKRNEVINSMKDRKTLERLRNKHYEVYLRDKDRAEQNMINEMATLRYKSKEIS